MNKPKPVTIRGTTYPSLTAAAKALDLSVSNIHRARELGTLDHVGMGRAGGAGRSALPITIRGTTYPSRADAARALGISVSAVSYAARNGGLDRVGLGSKIPVTIRGTTYPSIADAAASLGVVPSAISEALNRGTLDNVGLGRCVHVKIRGTTYPSYTAAAEALGVTYQAISQAARKGTLDRVGLRKWVRS
jgi:microsomal dipeptidase-like Zn-dependent dipeptidase